MLMLVRFIDICVMPYCSMYQPIALTDFREPGTHFGVPSAFITILPVMGSPSRTTLPASRTSNAIELARRVEVVLRLILYATRKSLAPMTVAPRLASNSAGPKSGFHSGNFIFRKNPSYSPFLITDRLLLFLSG